MSLEERIKKAQQKVDAADTGKGQDEERKRLQRGHGALRQLSEELEANLEQGTVSDLNLHYEMRSNIPWAIFQTPRHRVGVIFHEGGRKENPFTVGIPRPDDSIDVVGTVTLTDPLFEDRLLDLVGKAIKRVGG